MIAGGHAEISKPNRLHPISGSPDHASLKEGMLIAPWLRFGAGAMRLFGTAVKLNLDPD
jgi:hypothetical protein